MFADCSCFHCLTLRVTSCIKLPASSISFFSGMTPEGSRWRKLTKTMAHHVFSYVHGDKLLTVMYGKSVTNKLRCNHRSPAPGLDDFLFARLVQRINFALKFVINKWAFFKRTCHTLFFDSRSVDLTWFCV